MSKVCKRGHESSALPGGRYANRACKECRNAAKAKWRAENSEREAARKAKSYAENPERVKAAVAKWRAENPEREAARNAKYRAENSERAKAAVAKWRAENPGAINAIQARRRARKIAQLCTCCTSEQIAAFYEWARALGCDVDHKQALALGGLHCLKNLEALTPAEHMVKTMQWDAPLIAYARRAA